MQRFDVDGWTRRFRLGFIAENACRSLKELVFSLLDLVGVHVKLLGQFHQRLFASDGGERYFCLESRAVVSARSSRHDISCSRHLSRSQAEIPLIPAVQISRASTASASKDRRLRSAMFDDGLGFSLVPWTPAVEKQIGQHISEVARPDGGVDWSFGRKRGLGL